MPDEIQGDAIVITGPWDVHGFDGTIRLFPVATGWIFDVAESGAPADEYYGQPNGQPFEREWDAFRAAIQSAGENPDQYCAPYSAV